MSDKVIIETVGDTSLIPGDFITKPRFEEINAEVLSQGGEPATARQTILGITKSSLFSDSWLSASSFQETTKVLTEAALEGAEDNLVGLKENVIIGRLIPVEGNRRSSIINTMPTLITTCQKRQNKKIKKVKATGLRKIFLMQKKEDIKI
jgi:hypothetical protein